MNKENFTQAEEKTNNYRKRQVPMFYRLRKKIRKALWVGGGGGGGNHPPCTSEGWNGN